MAVQIINDSPDTLFFPDDFLVSGPLGPLSLLELDQTYELLLQDKYNNKYAPIVLGRGFGDSVVDGLGVGIKREIENKANERFYLELDKYYLWPCYIAPGDKTVGVIGLKVQKGPPLSFQLKN